MDSVGMSFRGNEEVVGGVYINYQLDRSSGVDVDHDEKGAGRGPNSVK